jgi:hypothetical protein
VMTITTVLHEVSGLSALHLTNETAEATAVRVGTLSGREGNGTGRLGACSIVHYKYVMPQRVYDQDQSYEPDAQGAPSQGESDTAVRQP